MPTQRPRLTITLTPEIDRALSAFSEGTGESRSAFIVSILEQSLPALEQLARVVQQAKNAKPEALARIAAGARKLGTKMEALSSLSLDTVDLFSAQVAPLAERSETTGRPGRRPANPPPPNRGGSTTTKNPKPSTVTPFRRRPRDAR